MTTETSKTNWREHWQFTVILVGLLLNLFSIVDIAVTLENRMTTLEVSQKFTAEEIRKLRDKVDSIR